MAPAGGGGGYARSVLYRVMFDAPRPKAGEVRVYSVAGKYFFLVSADGETVEIYEKSFIWIVERVCKG
jgi:hypothetical protein